GEVVRRVERGDRLAPAVAVDGVVPVGDDVAERAPRVAERDAAAHAARALLADRHDGEVPLDLAVVAKALLHRTLLRQDALVLEEPGRLAHGSPHAMRAAAPLRANARRYSSGMTFTKRRLSFFQPLRTRHASWLIVR